MKLSLILVIGALALAAAPAYSTLFSGPGGRGVPVGSSSLIGTLDYSDTFTGFDSGGSNSARVYVAAVQGAPAYVIENSYGNPAANLQTSGQAAGVAAFSFASDGAGLANGTPVYPGSSGAGSASGFTQTGGNVDYGIAYGLRSRYVVQFDAVASADRMDITTGSVIGTIFQPDSLSIFIRGGGSGGVSLYNGTLDTPVPGYNTGHPADGQWHNYAVLFDQTAKTVEIFVDEQSKGVIDLNSIAGGLYANFSNAAVGVGIGLAAGEDRSWTDNFQVGAPVPEPTAVALLALAGVGFLRRRRR